MQLKFYNIKKRSLAIVERNLSHCSSFQNYVWIKIVKSLFLYILMTNSFTIRQIKNVKNKTFRILRKVSCFGLTF